MKVTKEYRIKKALRDLEFGLGILNNDYVSHFSEPSLAEINKSFNFIKAELNSMVERNFGKISKKNIEDEK
jgi:hypothetical protein